MFAHAKPTFVSSFAARQNFLTAYLKDILALLPIWAERIKARRELAQLDMHMMDDIGLNYEEMHKEISKPFWRA